MRGRCQEYCKESTAVWGQLCVAAYWNIGLTEKRNRMLLWLKRSTIIQYPTDELYVPNEKAFLCKHNTWLPIYHLLNKQPDVYSAS